MGLGHSNPEVIETIVEQAWSLIHNSRHIGYLVARYASAKPGMIAFMPSFHGRALLALSATASKSAHRKRLTGLLPMDLIRSLQTP